MSPSTKIKQAILESIRESLLPDQDLGPLDTEEQVLDAWDTVDDFSDAIYDFRPGEVHTDIPSPYSRHYEADSVAAKMKDGSWVGWTYWHGGGKFGEPEAIEWMDEAYSLNCLEEEKVVVVRTFSRMDD